MGGSLRDAKNFGSGNPSRTEPRKIQFPISPHTKTSFGSDLKKQGCHEASMREGAAVIPPRGKLHTDATVVLSSPSISLVLEAVLTVIGGESAQAVPTPFERLPNFITLRAAAV